MASRIFNHVSVILINEIQYYYIYNMIDYSASIALQLQLSLQLLRSPASIVIFD